MALSESQLIWLRPGGASLSLEHLNSADCGFAQTLHTREPFKIVSFFVCCSGLCCKESECYLSALGQRSGECNRGGDIVAEDKSQFAVSTDILAVDELQDVGLHRSRGIIRQPLGNILGTLRTLELHS